jgi:chromosome segregation protein
LTVAKGYEAALGAALGDDLEAPVDPASPIRAVFATATGKSLFRQVRNEIP